MIELLLPLHVSCAGISFLLFLWRGTMMAVRRPLSQRLWRRTLPDTVDTLFLSSGVLMALQLAISPLDSMWLAAKIIGLLIYIGLGAVALTYGRSILVKRSCFVAALLLFGYLVLVAKSRSPWPVDVLL